MEAEAVAAKPVTISYETLLNRPETLQSQIETAFGSSATCLGLIIIEDLPPVYGSLRERLLRMAHTFASFDDATKERFVDSASSYSFGWSHGKEIMNGRPDTLKGSYYANPIVDAPTGLSEETIQEYPEYYSANIWPPAGEICLEQAFKELGRFIFGVGILLAKACQPFVSAALADKTIILSDLLAASQTTKGRLLHYYPPSGGTDESTIDSWCGFHLDHSVITGLCSAMYLLDKHDGDEPQAVASPSPSSGLYIRTRGGTLAKAAIPANALAFQTGEALQIATEGRLRATPHCVHVGSSAAAANISRETFALFMQPNTDQLIGDDLTFGQFSKRVFNEHYESSM